MENLCTLGCFLIVTICVLLLLSSSLFTHHELNLHSSLIPANLHEREGKNGGGHGGTNQNAMRGAQIPDDSNSCFGKLNDSCYVDPLIKYWEDTTDCYDSSLKRISGSTARLEDRRYILFQPDLGGWNNIRMSLETTMVFALATGRILVLPPDAVLYLLIQNNKWADNRGGVQDYIDFSRAQAGRAGLEVLHMNQFLEEIAIPGMLLKPFPSGIKARDLKGKELWEYLEAACFSRSWSPGKTFIAFNASSTNGTEVHGTFTSKPTAERLREFSIKRALKPYDDLMHSHRAIFFAGHNKNRMLTLFYAYFFFAEPKLEGLVKRFVRDRIRYHDAVFCAAGKIASLLNEKVRKDKSSLTKNSGSIRGNFVAFHVRRGDFQHKHVKLPANEILSLTSHLVRNSKERIAYIATDEKNLSFFDPFKEHFKAVYFLSDFAQSVDLKHLNQNYFGMIEQMVCASSDIFIGTPLSTFTGYISRIRGYMNLTTPGLYERTYYFMNKQMYQLHDHPHFAVPFWPREFVEAFHGTEL
jgi:hypothetical protein